MNAKLEPKPWRATASHAPFLLEGQLSVFGYADYTGSAPVLDESALKAARWTVMGVIESSASVAYLEEGAKCYVLQGPELLCNAAPSPHLQSHSRYLAVPLLSGTSCLESMATSVVVQRSTRSFHERPWQTAVWSLGQPISG